MRGKRWIPLTCLTVLWLEPLLSLNLSTPFQKPTCYHAFFPKPHRFVEFPAQKQPEGGLLQFKKIIISFSFPPLALLTYSRIVNKMHSTIRRIYIPTRTWHFGEEKYGPDRSIWWESGRSPILMWMIAVSGMSYV